MRKGFLHIIEIVVISLVMFLIVMQFTSVPGIPQNFDREKLVLTGNDVLFTLEQKGINWLDKNEVKREIDTLLNKTSMVYSLTLKNAIKSPVLVGCICSNSEYSFLQSLLTTFTLNNQTINFSVFQLKAPTPGPIAFTQVDATLPLIYDVIVAFDYDLAGDVGGGPYDYTNALYSYLKGGKGIVQVRDLDQAKLNLSEQKGKIQQYFFGVVYDQFTAPLSTSLSFTQTPITPFWPVQKYFHSFPFYREDFEDGVANNWAPFNSTWAIGTFEGNKWYNGSGTPGTPPGFNNFTFPLPENYTVQFDFNISAGFSAFWALVYLNPSQFTFAGASPNAGGQIIIATQAGASLISHALAAFPVSTNKIYTVRVSRQGNNVSAIIFNSTGGMKEISFNFLAVGGLPQGDKGLLLYLGPDSTLFDNFRFTYTSPYMVASFLGGQEKVNLSQNLTASNIILREQGGIPGLVAQKDFSIPSDIANPATSPVFLSGRSAWLSGGDNTLLEQQALIRALVTWAAGDTHPLIQATVPNPSVLTLLKTLNRDMFQPLEILLQVGYIF